MFDVIFMQQNLPKNQTFGPFCTNLEISDFAMNVETTNAEEHGQRVYVLFDDTRIPYRSFVLFWISNS